VTPQSRFGFVGVAHATVAMPIAISAIVEITRRFIREPHEFEGLML
jgi:hypothetical protein